MIILRVLAGLLAGAVYVVVAGILEVQISGSLAGGVYDLNNVIVAVTQPQIPFLQYVSLAVLSAAVLLLVMRQSSSDQIPQAIALVGSFAFAVIVLITWGFVLQGVAMAETGGVREGLPEGLSGWVLMGGLSVAVQAVGLVAALSAVLLAMRARRTSRLDPQGRLTASDDARARTL